jgi:hypothetical protein
MLHVIESLFTEKNLKYPSISVNKEIEEVEKQIHIRKCDN